MRPEDLALWYFRLNGFFTITNFVLHPERRGAQRTEADIVGVRLPHRNEFGREVDDEIFRRSNRLYLVIAEIKRGRCSLNEAWSRPDLANIQQVLGDLGAFAQADIPFVAKDLYDCGRYEDDLICCSLFCVGDSLNPVLPRTLPQKTWEGVLHFIYERFRQFDRLKTDHEQWDGVGQELWKASLHVTFEGFSSSVRQLAGLT
jgi:hypothetical protein